MRKASGGFMKAVATRSIIAAIPVAMASAYASNLFVPMPPRMAAYEYQQVAEITVSPTTVGVAASPLYGQTKAQIDQQLDDMQEIGVENIRVFVPWGLVDFFGPSQPGSLSWATLDLVMQSAKEHDMGVLAEVDSTPPYAVTAGTPGSGTPDPAAFAAFMTKFATKYGDVVSAYEIWNEPNGKLSSNPINPAAYAALLKAAYQVIKPLDPTATVVAGAVGHVITFGDVTMDPVDFVKAMIAADPTIGQYFDALSYHPYDESLPFSQGNLNPDSNWWASDTAYNQLKDLVALFPTKKVWITEFGVPTYTYTDPNGVVHTITQDQQEKYIADLINNWAAAFGQNAGPIFLYTGRDNTLTGKANLDNYGLWNILGQPKEVITEFLAQWFEDHPQNTTGPTNPGQTPVTPVTPANPLEAIFAVITAQIQAFAAQIQASVAAFVQAISNFFASLGGTPAVTNSAPLSLRVASVPTSNTPSDVDADVQTAAKTGKAAETDATAAVESEVTPKTEAVDAITTPAVVETGAETVEPAAEPVVVKTPETTEATTSPVAAEPASSTATEPASAPTTSSPADTGTSDTTATTAKPEKGDKTDKPDTATKPEKADKPEKGDKTDKAGTSGTRDSASSGTSSRPPKDKDDDASSTRVKPKTGSDGAGSDKGSDAKDASSSQSGSGSGGGGDEG